jgi:hypothetical protein
MSLLAHIESDLDAFGWYLLILLDVLAAVPALGGILLWLAFRNRPQDGMGDETKSVVRERPVASIRARNSERARASIVKRWAIGGAIVGFVFSTVGMAVGAIIFREVPQLLQLLPICAGTLQCAAVGFCIRYVVARSDARQAAIR